VEPLRLPVTWLNYRGDVVAGVEAGIAAGKAYGPRYLSPELTYPVMAVYDEATDTTRVGLSYVAPPAPGGAA
jgi:hypothetical protein